jgi:hypothetical protein
MMFWPNSRNASGEVRNTMRGNGKKKCSIALR